MFTRPQEPIIKEIEARTRNTFLRIGAPQPDDIVRVSGDEALANLAAVHPDAAAVFLPLATRALLDAEAATEDEGDGEDGGAPGAQLLARALAVISGYTQKTEGRSLLSSSDAFSTFKFSAGAKILSASYVWNGLKFELPPAIAEDFKWVLDAVYARLIVCARDAAAKQGVSIVCMYLLVLDDSLTFFSALLIVCAAIAQRHDAHR